ncbi:MAG: hypothetical protein KF764_05695 [Labilithrix sp.]|nr:hypothetical protein [Labilithrix sp.]
MSLLRAFPEQNDFWRIDAVRSTPAFKEWQHFVVFTKGLDLLVNFNVEERAGGERIARVILMGRTDTWHGVLDTVPVEISKDARRARFGAARLDIADGGYHVSLDWPSRRVAIRLAFHPVAMPIYTADRPPGGRRLYWALVARANAFGTVRLGDRTFELANALAYHDHNWGSFAWGDDLAWEWGSILPEDVSSPYACVYNRVTNRARTVAHSQHLFVWREARNVLAAQRSELRVTQHGRLEVDARPFRLPAGMALIDSRRDVDLPERLEIEAGVGHDAVDVRFRTEATARILVPSEVDPLGKVVIHECVGDALVRGTIGSEPFSFGGRGVFELLRS